MIEVYIDGSYTPSDNGAIGFGAVIYNNGIKQKRYGGKPPNQTNNNNVAEYLAAINTMELMEKECLTEEEILIKADSKLVVNQLNGYWKIKKGDYVEYANRAKELVKKFSNLRFKWIPREENLEADKLSRIYPEKK